MNLYLRLAPGACHLPIDEPTDVGKPEPKVPLIMGEDAEKEQDYLDQLFPKGRTVHEATRRKEWLSLPRETRAAIRRLHKMMGHKPRSIMAVIM